MKKIGLFIVTVATSLGFITACNSANNPQTSESQESSTFVETLDHIPTEIDHYYSNRISFADMNLSLGNNKFMANRIAKLKLKSVTDGDTAVFHLDGEKDGYTNPLGNEYSYLTVRFLAIDTPESTSSIAPWGKKASAYVKDKLYNAEGIIVDATSIDVSDKTLYPTVNDTYKSGVRLDSNGTRWLGMIWYCPKDGDPSDYSQYRSLQLDVIEECYSTYTANLQSEQFVYNADQATEPLLYERYKSNYGTLSLSEVLFEASVRMQRLGARKIGAEIDPDYDYSDTPQEATIKEAYDNFDEWESKAKFLSLTGVITAFIGNNFYFQDAEGYPLYVYMGIEGKSINNMFSVGDTISIRGRLATYGGQKQLSDVVWKRDTFVKVTDPTKMIALPEPIALENTNLTRAYLDQYMGKLVTMELTGQKTGNLSKDKSFSLTSNQVVTDLNSEYNEMEVRINGTLNPSYTKEEIQKDLVDSGAKFIVKGIMSTFFMEDVQDPDNLPSYQIIVGNRPVDNDGKFGTDFVIVK